MSIERQLKTLRLMKKSSAEMFYLDENGNKQDRALHENLLGDDTFGIENVRAEKLAEGWTQERVDLMWPLPGPSSAD